MQRRFRPTVPAVIRRTACAAALISLAAGGCATLRPEPAKQAAEQRWNSVRARTKLQLARKHAEHGRFDDVLGAAGEAIALDPTLGEAYGLVARANLELGRLTSAEQAIRAARDRGIESPELPYLTGVIHEQRGEIEAAARSYRTARTQAWPGDADPARHDKAHATAPGLADCLIAEAECLVQLGRAEEALSLLTTNHHSADGDAAVAVLAARTAALLRDTDVAIRWYRTAHAQAPDSLRIAQHLGLLLAQTGRCAEAAPLLRRCIDQAAPGGTDRREPDPSGPPFQVAGGPDSPDRPIGAVFRALAGCHLAADDPAAAVATLGPYLAGQPDDAAGQFLLAQASLGTGDLRAADRSLDRAAANGAPDADIRYLKSVLAWKRGRLEAAAAELERFLASNPSHADASCLLGTILVDLGRPGEAAVAFERALHASPGNAWASTGLERLSQNPSHGAP